MPYDRHPGTTGRKLIGPAAAGFYGLPPEILEAHRRLVAAKEASARHRSRPDLVQPARQALFTGVMEAVATGGELPDGSVVTTAEAAERNAAILAATLERSAEAYQGAFVDAVRDSAEMIVTDFLRPAHDETIEAARAAVASLKGFPLHGDALLEAPASVRKAYASLGDIGERLMAVREARRIAVSFAPPVVDEYDVLASLKNGHLIHIGFRQQQAVPPWPMTSARDYLLWLLTARDPEPQAWCPTGAEQDEAYGEIFKVGIAGMARQRSASQAVAAWGASRAG